MPPPKSLGWEEPEASVETALQPQRDYRSEGEQPSTERNGNRRSLKSTRQGSFRAARMPKRGGRKRLRRHRPVRRKIRVSSYCVSRGLKTLQLLRWLETLPNRLLSQSIRAHGGSGPRGPISAATRTAAEAAAAGAGAVGAVVGGASARPAAARGGGRSYVERCAGTPTATAAAATAAGRREGASAPEQLEWMDSLYIDVIHSTTDLRGGLRKARDLERPAWEDVVDEEEESGDGGSYDAGAVKERRAGRREGSGSRGREEEEDDDNDVVTHKDVIYFPYGAVVFWGCSEAEVCAPYMQGIENRGETSLTALDRAKVPVGYRLFVFCFLIARHALVPPSRPGAFSNKDTFDSPANLGAASLLW